ncbi:MAG: hypothetical protein KR126chlam2_00857 [Chlamydiae bacterium]|nr:hypothetical protein [Chlamydiota bacterium]
MNCTGLANRLNFHPQKNPASVTALQISFYLTTAVALGALLSLAAAGIFSAVGTTTATSAAWLANSAAVAKWSGVAFGGTIGSLILYAIVSECRSISRLRNMTDAEMRANMTPGQKALVESYQNESDAAQASLV